MKKIIILDNNDDVATKFSLNNSFYGSYSMSI